MVDFSLSLRWACYILCLIPSQGRLFLRSLTVTAHRGACSDHPENTRAAFLAAIELSVDIIEFDVRLTRDEELIVIHDDRVDRISDGTGLVAELDLAQMLAFDAGSWFHERFSTERFLTFSQILDLMPPRMGLNVNVKATDADREVLVPRVVESLAQRQLLRTAFVTGSEENLLVARRVEPEVLICSNLPVPRCVEMGCQLLQPANGITTSELVVEAHEQGIEVHPFYADEAAEMQRLIDCGVDGILTNFPQRLQRLTAPTALNQDT
jgi:glycerophosphoryl diester phosphodiesterase